VSAAAIRRWVIHPVAATPDMPATPCACPLPARPGTRAGVLHPVPAAADPPATPRACPLPARPHPRAGVLV
jgi:hypothetical protein